jgi:hypothetical protein
MGKGWPPRGSLAAAPILPAPKTLNHEVIQTVEFPIGIAGTEIILPPAVVDDIGLAARISPHDRSLLPGAPAPTGQDFHLPEQCVFSGRAMASLYARTAPLPSRGLSG